MKLIIDASTLDLYRDWPHHEQHGGTETMVKKLAAGLAGLGHTVNVVAPGIEDAEHGEDGVFWWGTESHPTKADCVVMVPSLENIGPYSAPLLVCATNGIGHYLGPNNEWAAGVDAWPVFSQKHADLLHKTQGVPLEKCHVTGLGVDVEDYRARYRIEGSDEIHEAPNFPVPGRILVSNDPQRGLWHVLDIFDKLKEKVPHATLHISYDVQMVIDQLRWQAVAMAQTLLDCERRIKADPSITLLGNLSRAELIREQLECQVHVWPSDPPNLGSQIHGISQGEIAAAGGALLLSDIEAFPEVFGDCAEFLPVPGTYLPAAERRVDPQDWADVVADIMLDPERWADMSRRSRLWAERNTWSHVIRRWEEMFAGLAARLANGQVTPDSALDNHPDRLDRDAVLSR